MHFVFVWTFGDVISLLVIGLIILVVLIGSLKQWFKQARCKHNNVHETRACDAVCSQCGKNLGFIGTWRERHKTGE